MRTSPAGSDAGFTLTELLVVLAIMALVVSVTPALYLTVVPSARLKSASVDLLAYLRGARLEAGQTGVPVVLTISDGTIRASGEAGKVFEAPSGTVLSYKPAFGADRDTRDLTFLPGGGSSGGTLALKRGEAARTLSINWLTGQIAIAP